MWHSCVSLTLADTFAGCGPDVLPAFERFAQVASEEGGRRDARIRVIPQRSRAVLVARVRFASGQPRTNHALAAVALRRRVADPWIRHIVAYGPRPHELLLATPDDVDGDVRSWLADSIAVGIQDDRYEGVSGSLD